MEESLHSGTMWRWKHFPNAPMVPSPQAIPNHSEPIEDRKIKPKTFRKSHIGGEF